MKDVEQRAAAEQFAADWKDRGDEKQETQSFWLALLQKVYGIAEPEKYIAFETPVKLDHTSFIDGLINETRVLIEQKSLGVDLKKGYKQSDGSTLTPFAQARRYAGYLPHNLNPRWIVVCNFQEFQIHDMNRPNDEPEIVCLSDLEQEYARLNFLVDTGDENIKKEMQVSLQAGEIVGVLYDALLKQYKDPDNAETLKSLNALCVRLVFCLYAEDAGIFGKPNMFHDYMREQGVKNARNALIALFKILDTKEEERDKYIDDDLAAFPYVNGGLFSDENIIIPRLNEEIVDLILRRASEDFDWSAISPTIFGAVFESTLNPETRRSGGMHYTSIENIHKVIDPLFLDDLKAELAEIVAIQVERTRRTKLEAFQNKLAGLQFLDPACGSGNFLTETYLSLRRLENEALSELHRGQIVFDVGNPIKVHISQFYGIEINDFAVTVAKTALWIAESQMMKETEAVVHMSLDFLPLKSYANIVEGNALRLDWESVVPKSKLNYIMGNPPFVGYSLQSKSQKDDILSVYVDESGKPYSAAGKNDYVAGWYYKAAQYMQGSGLRTAFVSTNSISQGEQVANTWKPLFDQFGIHIDFAHRTFQWDSEASLKAHVHCVIIGFSVAPNRKQKVIYTGERTQEAKNINAYLMDAPNIFVANRNKPICDVPEIVKGSSPVDGGNFFLNEEQYRTFEQIEPNALKYIKRFYGAKEYIHNIPRWCLWLNGVSPAELSAMPEVKKRVASVKEFRQAILDARALYPDSSLADLYDETTMPPELRKAHQDNDRAVMRAYGFPIKGMTESLCVAELMKMYQALTQ